MPFFWVSFYWNVIPLSVIMLKCYYSEFHFTEMLFWLDFYRNVIFLNFILLKCHYSECHFTEMLFWLDFYWNVILLKCHSSDCHFASMSFFWVSLCWNVILYSGILMKCGGVQIQSCFLLSSCLCIWPVLFIINLRFGMIS